MTRDIDVVLEPGSHNIERVRALIAEWGATRSDGSPVSADTIATGKSIHLATPHGHIDLLAEQASPLTFAGLIARADVRSVDGVAAPICSLADLVALKRIASRERDLADLTELEAAHGNLPDSRND